MEEQEAKFLNKLSVKLPILIAQNINMITPDVAAMLTNTYKQFNHFLAKVNSPACYDPRARAVKLIKGKNKITHEYGKENFVANALSKKMQQVFGQSDQEFSNQKTTGTPPQPLSFRIDFTYNPDAAIANRDGIIKKKLIDWLENPIRNPSQLTTEMCRTFLEQNGTVGVTHDLGLEMKLPHPEKTQPHYKVKLPINTNADCYRFLIDQERMNR